MINPERCFQFIYRLSLVDTRYSDTQETGDVHLHILGKEVLL